MHSKILHKILCINLLIRNWTCDLSIITMLPPSELLISVINTYCSCLFLTLYLYLFMYNVVFSWKDVDFFVSFMLNIMWFFRLLCRKTDIWRRLDDCMPRPSRSTTIHSLSAQAWYLLVSMLSYSARRNNWKRNRSCFSPSEFLSSSSERLISKSDYYVVNE